MRTSADTKTYLPNQSTRDQVAKIIDFMAARERAGHEPPEPRYFLAGAEAGDMVELTPDVHAMLRQIIDAIGRGQAVTIAPTNHILTTQEAADILGVSRPTVIKLLDGGEIPFEKVRTHRRIRLGDLLEYRENRRAAQYAALAATAEDEPADPDELHEFLREARRTVSERRRRTS
ncbi:helix-turn-helix domain-containing protein [Georgenia satyanarayanai]|uniref:helix-turn-helix domain-containing protein n=1 Tax=Georgenia satyanarayanai TaxID=860221 RepID=UPI00203AF990|nr:helix-turn-helix domain-containing protein [Georgenia satyanarayanai]MCM3661356.1 helix-turn-helix domain-containing protein [Georgenia satyanarayanai]